MLPDRYVIIWNGLPIGVDDRLRPYKTSNHATVAYWATQELAQEFLSRELMRDPTREFSAHVARIQFKIVEA